MTETRELTEDQKAALGLLFREPKSAERIAIALDRPIAYVREMVEALTVHGLLRRLPRPDKPHFVATASGREAAL